MNWSSAVLLGFTWLTAIQCNVAHAMTYEETACVSQTMSEGGDVTKCFNVGGDGGSAGSGGSGSADSGSTGGAKGGQTWPSWLGPDTCPTPTFWFTGPPDMSTATDSLYFQFGDLHPGPLATERLQFDQNVGGKPYHLTRTRDLLGLTATITWQAAEIGGADQQTSKCTEYIY